MPPWLNDLLRPLLRLPNDVAETRKGIGAIQRHLTRMERHIMTAASGFAAQLDQVTTDIANRIDGLVSGENDLKAQLAAILANQDQATQDQVNAALDSAFAGLAPELDRLRALGTPQGEVPVPTDGGDVPTPAPTDGGDVTA